VVADHKTASIVVAIRGSISLRDIFTDLTATAEKFKAEGVPDNTMVRIPLLHVHWKGRIFHLLRSTFYRRNDVRLRVCLPSLPLTSRQTSCRANFSAAMNYAEKLAAAGLATAK